MEGDALDLSGSWAHPEPLLVSMAITQGMSAGPQSSESRLPSGSRALRSYLPHTRHLCLLSVLSRWDLSLFSSGSGSVFVPLFPMKLFWLVLHCRVCMRALLPTVPGTRLMRPAAPAPPVLLSPPLPLSPLSPSTHLAETPLLLLSC